MSQCSCIVCFKRDGKQGSRRCRNAATRAVKVHQEHEHGQVGTGWFWVDLCETHFFASELRWATMKLREDWKWL